MFKALGWLIKVSAFAAVVLVLGNWIKWDNRTVSDQVKTQISHAERSEVVGSIKKWTSGVVEDSRKGARKSPHAVKAAPPHANRADATETPVEVVKTEKRPEEHSAERIESSERQKLKALIQELNSSSGTAHR